MSVLTNKNIFIMESDKLCKHRDFKIEIQKMWKLRTVTL